MSLLTIIDRTSRSLRLWLWVLLSGLVLTGINALVVNPLIVANIGVGIFDANPLLDRAEIAAAVPTLADDAWSGVVMFYVIDFVFPALFGLALAGGFAFGVRNLWPHAYEAGRLNLLMLVPFVAVLTDWGENIAALWLLGAYRPINESLLTMLVVFRTLKLAALGLAVICAAVGLVGIFASRSRRHAQQVGP